MTREPATGDYEIDRQRHVRALEARLSKEVEKMTWPLARLHALRDERLRTLIRTSKERSPWHAERLRHINPDTFTVDGLSAIPTMTKRDLMTHRDAIVTDRRLTLAMANDHLARVAERGPAYLLDEYHVITSGGTSGHRGVFAWDFEGWLLAALAERRAHFWLAQRGLLAGKPRMAVVKASHSTHISALISRCFAGDNETPVLVIPVSRPMGEIVSALNRFNPVRLAIYPAILHRVAQESLAGRLDIRPEMVICSGEPLLPEIRAAAEEAFGAHVINMYAASELGLMARAYPGSPGMHLSEDTAVYEPVDAAGSPAPVGGRAAKMLITNVMNPLLPLIRYELTDEVTFPPEHPKAPWTGRRIADVHARADDVFVYPGGIVVHPYIFWLAFGRVPEVVEYQVRQTLRGVEVAVRDVGAIDLDAVREEVHEALVRLGLSDPQVSMTQVDAMDRLPGSGKLKRFFALAKESHSV